MAGSGRRFVLEAIFLASLAVAAGLADLTTSQIIGVMTAGWVVTVLIELVSWRLAVRHPGVVAVSQPLVVPEADAGEVTPGQEPEPQAADEPEPARRKRGFFRRPPREEEPEPVEEPVEPPRHVRLIERANDEDTGTHDTPEQRAEGA